MWTPQPGNIPGQSKNPDENRASSAAEDLAQRNRLNQIFNTALVSSRSDTNPYTATEIHKLMETPSFRAILQATQLLAGDQGVSEIEAAREIIRTFRKMDQLWTEYLVAEGVERLKVSG